jgi:solute carrier family 25 carnitine/acylcarnitine transporter 20/29
MLCVRIGSVRVGHPFDSIKTKMQAQEGFAGGKGGGGGMLSTLRHVLKTQGVGGLYKGWVPPMWGSGIYRSTQVHAHRSVEIYICHLYISIYTCIDST